LAQNAKKLLFEKVEKQFSLSSLAAEWKL